ncbi:MAG: hypothetical protein L0Y58_09395 [Verrucomicrobia subdivision 3 bacterium]|nr:hypothetical protein [Limisphaerales bacterium]
MIHILALLVIQLTTFRAAAALMASDAANNSAYDNGWQDGDNGGSGFGAWVLASNGANAGHMIGDSTALAPGNSGANINTGGESFRMSGHLGQFATALRPLSGTLSVGDTLSFVIAVNNQNGSKGFNLRDSANMPIWSFDVLPGTYQAGGTPVFDNEYADTTAFHFTFTQNDSTLSWTINRSGDLSGVESGTANIPVGSVAGIRFYVSDTLNSDPENNLYINSMSMAPVPEPVNVALMIFGGIAFASAAWRRWRR